MKNILYRAMVNKSKMSVQSMLVGQSIATVQLTVIVSKLEIVVMFTDKVFQLIHTKRTEFLETLLLTNNHNNVMIWKKKSNKILKQKCVCKCSPTPTSQQGESTMKYRGRSKMMPLYRLIASYPSVSFSFMPLTESVKLPLTKTCPCRA